MTARTKKVLVVPSRHVTTYSHRHYWQVRRVLSALVRGCPGEAVEVLTSPLLLAEVLHFGDLPKILGPANTFVLGRYYQDYRRTDVPEHTRYPSLCKTPLATHVAVGEAPVVLRAVDAVIIGRRAGTVGEGIRRLARQRDMLVAILDYFDDVGVYAVPLDASLTGGLEHGRDYELYFKHDIPLGRASDTLLPLAPMPVRPESYAEAPPPAARRDISVFYRGQQRLGVLRGDRAQLADLLRASLPDAVVDNQPNRRTYGLREYWDRLARAKIALTPSGKVWDSTRHCETAMFGCVPLIPVPDCETVHDIVHDGDNALGYKTQRQASGEYTVVEPETTVERVKAVLQDERELARLSAAWRAEVLEHHTTEARAGYLLDAIGRRT